MGIVNAGQLEIYDQIPTELRDAVEDVVLNRTPWLPPVCWPLLSHSPAVATRTRKKPLRHLRRT